MNLDDAERADMRKGMELFLRARSVSAGSSDRQQSAMHAKNKVRAKREAHGLRPQEKIAMREQLLTHMKKIPVQESASFAERASEMLAMFLHGFVPRLALSAFVLFVLGGSAAYAAQSTLPGDTLYPIKVNVYEPVVSWFTVTADAQASWNADRALRRLEEAEQLAARSALTHDTLTEIERRFAEHVNHAHVSIAELADDDADTAATLSAELESNLQAHGSIIQLLDDDGDAENGVSRLLEQVESAGADIAVVRSRAEKNSLAVDDEQSVRAEALRRMNHSLQHVRKLRREIEGVGTSNAPSLDRLSQAESFLEQANVRLQQGSATDALEFSRNAIRMTEEGKLFFSTGDDETPVTDEASSSSSQSPAQSSSSSSDSSEETNDPLTAVPVDDDEDDGDDEDENEEAFELPDIDIDLPL